MPLAIEDYALIGGCHTAALVGRDGSIDWLCFPRFDSGACFAALLGEPRHGRWLIAPAGAVQHTQRRYREGSLILETDFETAEGAVRIIDSMPLSDDRWNVVRIVEGLRGQVRMRMELIIRFDYGWIVPWVRRRGDTLVATAGPDALELHAGVPTHGEKMTTVAEFEIRERQRTPFVLNYRSSYETARPATDPEQALEATERSWRAWSGRCTYQGRWRDAVARSLITLKALTYAPTGGIVAAPTSSLPEQLGGVRNWDYRYCWLRDATFTLNALLFTGFDEEAAAWREWLLRAVAGRQEDLQALYRVTGDGLVRRYSSARSVDSLPPGEGAFLPCSFWLADNLALAGRHEDAEALFERLLGLRNDLGLLSEAYDPCAGSMLGNFPQALTHVALVNTARLLSMPRQEAQRSGEAGDRPAAIARTPSTARRTE